MADLACQSQVGNQSTEKRGLISPWPVLLSQKVKNARLATPKTFPDADDIKLKHSKFAMECCVCWPAKAVSDSSASRFC